MSKKAVYKTFREENGETKIDLTVMQEDEVFEVDEAIHHVHISELSSDELNMVLSGLDVPEEVKLEIKKAVLKKHIGALEENRSKFDELLPRLKDDADYISDNIELEYKQFEERVKQELSEMEEKFNKFLDKF